jgi:hypothetical protein
VTLAGLEHLRRWHDAIQPRPAVQRGLAVPPKADLGDKTRQTVEATRKFLA